ncbi:MAG TPA: lipopolysaccharide biosynthesis protein [Rhizomicrobium sp.]|nr:lipopolysaccharide biosynthesis protein [Rhizomicrobium sp.]
MATSKQAAHGLFWSTLERVATQGISFVVVLLLAKLLGPHSYGLVTLAATIALLGQMLLGETFSQALIQEKTIEPAHTSSLFWLLAGFGLLATGGQYVCADEIAKIFDQPALAPILRALSPLFLLTGLQAVPAALFKRELNFRALAAASTFGTLLGGAVGLALAFTGFGIWSLVANLLVQNTIVTVTIWRKSEFFPALEFSRSHLHGLWSYGQYTLLLRIAAFTANQSPRLIVGYLFGPAALGAFSLGLRIVEILYQLLVIPATNVMVPMIARIRETPDRLVKAILDATQLVAMIAVPVYVALAITAPIVIPMFFGEQWLASVLLVQILSVYGVIGSCGLIWQSIVGGLGRPDIALRTTVLAAITSVAVLFLAARWGLTAAAVAFVLRGYITLPFMPIVLARLTGIPAARQYRALVPIAAAALIMAVTISASMAEFDGKIAPILILVFALISGGIAYGVALLVFARPAIQRGFAILGHLQPGKNLA